MHRWIVPLPDARSSRLRGIPAAGRRAAGFAHVGSVVADGLNLRIAGVGAHRAYAKGLEPADLRGK